MSTHDTQHVKTAPHEGIVGYCPHCRGKRTFLTRRAAKRAARRAHPGHHLHAYPCPAGKGWHYGHLPRAKADPFFPAPPSEGDTPE